MKRILAVFLAMTLLVVGIPFTVSAACVTSSQSGTNLPGSNANHQNYHPHGRVITSYMSVQPNGQILTISKTTEYVLDINYYTSQYKLVKNRRLSLELPEFGGVYETDEHFYVVTGQNNEEEINDKEVIRVTRYNKNWERLDHASVPSFNTVHPFVGGSLRFAYDGKILFVRTCHEMYASKTDGKNHQANLTFSVDTETMELIYSMDAVANLNYGYVSHSFNQFIRYHDGLLYAVDHGDGYPRAVCLMKYTTKSFREPTGAGLGIFEHANVIDIPGAIGDNNTNVSVGAFEMTNTGFLVAGTTKISRATFNVYLAYVSDDLTTKNVLNITNSSSVNYTTPHLAKMSDDSYLLLWSNFDGTKVYYQEVNAQGELVGKQYAFSGQLSDCAPIVSGGKVMWYTYSNNKVTFYTISTSTLKATLKTVDNGHQYVYKSNATEHWRVCKDCNKKTGSSAHSVFDTSFDEKGNISKKCSTCGYASATKKIEYTIKETVKEDGNQSLAIKLVSSGNVLQNNVDYIRSITSRQVGYVNGKPFYTKLDLTFQTPNITSVLSGYTKSFYRLPNYASVASISNQVYTGKAITPTVKVTASGKTLKKNTDYTVSYKNNTKKGTATVTITGKGSYFGTITKTFKIVSGITSAKVTGIKTKAYTGKAITQSPKVVLKGKTLKKNIDYTISYKNNKKVGTATLTIKGTGNYGGTITKTFKILTNISAAKVTGIKTKSYTGKAITQSPKVVLKGKTLKKGTDYTLTYENNKKVGKATVTIKGKGKYAGTISKTFVIRTKKMSISSLRSSSKKKAKVTWKTDKAASGYEIVYSTSSKFTKKTTINTKASSRVITGLKSGKTYYVKIRSKKVIGGKTYYGEYSAVKKVRVK